MHGHFDEYLQRNAQQMKKHVYLFAAIFGLTAIILGAFGAHGLEGKLTAEHLDSYETGVRYQVYHAIVLLILALKHHVYPSRFDIPASNLMIPGTVLFSFSIYLLSTSELTGLHWTWLGPVTPLGGLLLIIGWVLLLVDAIRLFVKKGA